MNNAHLFNNYAPLDIVFTHGKGAQLWDSNGQSYLDALGGIAVTVLGHAHPAVTQAIHKQAAEFLHCSNLYHIEQQERLGQSLCSKAGMEKAFFCNSGTEANEAAIKLARLHGHQLGYTQPVIAVTEQAFHGRTMAALSATGNSNAQKGFAPLLDGFARIPYNDLTAFEELIAATPELVAILVEPIQGEGGINVPEPDYLPGLRALCDQHNLLLMLDEIQTGIGRTGRWFAWQHSDARPDVLTSAKALGNGVPIGACMAQGQAAKLFTPGTHGSTFGGNPLACAAANAVLDTIEAEQLLQRALELDALLFDGFASALGEIEGVKEIRGQGLMIGIELAKPCTDLVNQALQAGLLINVTAGNVLRLLPAINLSDSEAEAIVAQVSELIIHFLHNAAES